LERMELTSASTVRRHNLRRRQRLRPGKRDKLLQLVRHLFQQRVLDRHRVVLGDEGVRVRAVITARACEYGYDVVFVSEVSCTRG
jgi:hypothetical protein